MEEAHEVIYQPLKLNEQRIGYLGRDTAMYHATLPNLLLIDIGFGSDARGGNERGGVVSFR